MKRNSDPVVVMEDRFINCGASLVKSFFPFADDETCATVAAGAFMAILTERENGKVLFCDEHEPEHVYRFPTRNLRAKQ